MGLRYLPCQGKEVKQKWKPHYYKHSGPIEPDREILESARARELLCTWELTQDKALVDRHLKASEKVYGKDSEERIRNWMRVIRNNERNT
jgi:hypothetical protein